MADKMGLSKIQLFPANEMARIANLHIPVFKRRVQGGIDAYGRRFKIYTNKYMTLKSNKFKSEVTGKRYAYPKARISSGQVYPPNLTLTGFMLQNLKRRSYNKHEYVLGWTGEEAEKVQGNADNGRDIISDVPNKEKDFIIKLLGKAVDKELRKLKNVDIYVG
jgi:hypothetical protein